MTKFKWGNFSTAKYLDHESLTFFYPMITRLYLDVIESQIKLGKTSEAKLALNKYMTDLPNIIPVQEILPVQEVAIRKFYLADSAYHLGEKRIGDSLVALIDDYLVKSLNYNYRQYKDGKTSLDNDEIQLDLSLLNGIAGLAKKENETGLAAKYQAQLKDFSGKFGIGMEK
jgi:hypothetical protein